MSWLGVRGRDSFDAAASNIVGKKVVQTLDVHTTPFNRLKFTPAGGRADVVAGDKYVAIIDLSTLEVSGRISTGKGPT